jgi:outer membrane protein OmpA-like peptidoglycan-associated protein
MKQKLRSYRTVSVLTGITIMISSVFVLQNSVQAAPATNGPIFIIDQWNKLLNSDGSTADAPSYLTGAPVYSHDGTKMAWVHQKSGLGSFIKTANADGTLVKTLLDSSSFQFDKVQFTSDNKLILLDHNRDTLYSIDSVTENQTLTAGNEFLKLITGGFTDISVSKGNKLAYVSSTACPPPGAGTFLSGVFVTDISATTGPGSLVAGTCSNPSTGERRASQIVEWDSAGTNLFVGLTVYESTTSVRQKIAKFDLLGTIDWSVTVGTETSDVSNTFTTFPRAISISPDGTKLAVVTEKVNSWEYKLWTLSTTGTGLAASNAVITWFIMSWAQPITLDAPPLAPPAPAPPAPPAPAPAPAPVATVAPVTTTTTTVPVSIYDTAIPGITLTDQMVYETAPSKVASNSAIMVLSNALNKTADVASKTPSICLPSDNDLVFIKAGSCVADVINTKTLKVIRTLKTTVVNDDIAEVEVGNKVSVLAPWYFTNSGFQLKLESLSRLMQSKDQITSAGSILVAGHSGTITGNSPENVRIAKARADATVAILKANGVSAPLTITSVGALDPATTSKSQAAQAMNRRVVIILIP